MAEEEESAYALIGAAFVKLLRDETAPKEKREAALKLASYWLLENGLPAKEALFIVDNTGLIFDPVFDPLFPKASENPSTWGDDVPF